MHDDERDLLYDLLYKGFFKWFFKRVGRGENIIYVWLPILIL